MLALVVYHSKTTKAVETMPKTFHSTLILTILFGAMTLN